MFEHNGRFNSRDYDKFERMKLMESPVRDAIHELKTYSLETLAQRFDVRLLERGKRVFARLDAEDDKWYYLSLAYTTGLRIRRKIDSYLYYMGLFYAFRIFDHQKAPGKGGHHLGLFDPLTHLLGSGRSGAWPTSQNLGPPVKGIASFRK